MTSYLERARALVGNNATPLQLVKVAFEAPESVQALVVDYVSPYVTSRIQQRWGRIDIGSLYHRLRRLHDLGYDDFVSIAASHMGVGIGCAHCPSEPVLNGGDTVWLVLFGAEDPKAGAYRLAVVEGISGAVLEMQVSLTVHEIAKRSGLPVLDAGPMAGLVRTGGKP